MGVGRDLAGEHHQAGVAQRLGGDARARVLREDRVEDGVRDLVGHLVGVAFGDGFGGEEEVVRHIVAPDAIDCAARKDSRCRPGLWRSGERFSGFVSRRPASSPITRRPGNYRSRGQSPERPLAAHGFRRSARAQHPEGPPPARRRTPPAARARYSALRRAAAPGRAAIEWDCTLLAARALLALLWLLHWLPLRVRCSAAASARCCTSSPRGARSHGAMSSCAFRS